MQDSPILPCTKNLQSLTKKLLFLSCSGHHLCRGSHAWQRNTHPLLGHHALHCTASCWTYLDKLLGLPSSDQACPLGHPSLHRISGLRPAFWARLRQQRSLLCSAELQARELCWQSLVLRPCPTIDQRKRCKFLCHNPCRPHELSQPSFLSHVPAQVLRLSVRPNLGPLDRSSISSDGSHARSMAAVASRRAVRSLCAGWPVKIDTGRSLDQGGSR